MGTSSSVWILVAAATGRPLVRVVRWCHHSKPFEATFKPVLGHFLGLTIDIFMQMRFPELSAARFKPCGGAVDQNCTALNIVAFERAWKALDEYVRRDIMVRGLMHWSSIETILTGPIWSVPRASTRPGSLLR